MTHPARFFVTGADRYCATLHVAEGCPSKLSAPFLHKMPDSTPTRRRLIEAALQLLMEEGIAETVIEFPLANGDLLHIDVRRQQGRGQRLAGDAGS